jgi:LPS O-antigen subunit length determinant protein (WzzB/FepE family)
MNNNLDAGRSDDEIDLAEVFANLWAHKLAISLLTAVAIIIRGAYAL